MKYLMLTAILILATFSKSVFAQNTTNSLNEQLIGTWQYGWAKGSATNGANESDAGFAQRLCDKINEKSFRFFNADGTYKRLALDIEGNLFTRKGTWQLEGSTLTMTETHGDGAALDKPNVLVWYNISFVTEKTLIVTIPYEQGKDKKGKIEVNATFMKK